MRKSSYVLFKDGARFFAAKKVGTKADYEKLEMFHSFHPTFAAAMQEAEQQTVEDIKRLKEYVREYRRKKDLE